MSENDQDTATLLRNLMAQPSDPTWAKFWQKYEPVIRYECRRAGCPESDVDDVMQEIFVLLYTGLGEFDPAKGSLRTWLAACCKNAVISAFRKKTRLKRGADIGHVSIGEDVDPYDDSTPGVFTVVAKLEDGISKTIDLLIGPALVSVRDQVSEQNFAIFLSQQIRGESAQDVARSFDTTVVNVYQVCSRVRHLIRRELDRNDG